MLLEHFTKGTQHTRTGSSIGAEIETDFALADGTPITKDVTDAILRATQGRPTGCEQKLELGVQKIELAIAPQPSFSLLWESMQESLDWLYQVATKYEAFPVHTPEFVSETNLLYVQEERDALWVQLDGKAALEHLCRCSSVQFTVAVHPSEAITMLNALWKARLHEVDYARNDYRWQRYIQESFAGYRADRYGGPEGFNDMADYVHQLEKHEVRMHRGQPVRLPISNVKNPDIELFLRSVWWHHRLRRYGDTLAIEMRPFARRNDQTILQVWNRISSVLGL